MTQPTTTHPIPPHHPAPAAVAAEALAPARPAETADGPPLVARLVQQHGAAWVDRDTLDDFLCRGGDQVLFFQGDPVRFPEVLDLAVVLPELQRAFPGRFHLGVVRRADEDAVAARFGANRWPALLFLRDGQYVQLLPGMHDWTDYLRLVADALALPARRAPSVGIAVVAAGSAGPGCH